MADDKNNQSASIQSSSEVTEEIKTVLDNFFSDPPTEETKQTIGRLERIISRLNTDEDVKTALSLLQEFEQNASNERAAIAASISKDRELVERLTKVKDPSSHIIKSSEIDITIHLIETVITRNEAMCKLYDSIVLIAREAQQKVEQQQEVPQVQNEIQEEMGADSKSGMAAIPLKRF